MIEDAHLAGQTLRNRYHLDTELARGALAVVFRGRDRVLKRPIAVKVAPIAHAASYRAGHKATANLTHPAVIAVYDTLEEEDGALYIIQEMVEGRSLAAYLRAGLPSARALDLGGQIARALAYVHAHDVVHGDLTPSAVLVDRHARVRLNNFGLPPDSAYFARLSRVLEGEAPTRRIDKPVGGSSTRASAEAAGDMLPSPVDDVRAVGLLLWQLLTAEAVASASPEARTFRDDVPEDIRDLVQRALWRIHPEAITDAETLALALEDAARQLNQQRPADPQFTPPALKALRDAYTEPGHAPSEATVQPGYSRTMVHPGVPRGPGELMRGAQTVDSFGGGAPTELGPPQLHLPTRPFRESAFARPDPRLPRWPGPSSALSEQRAAAGPTASSGGVNTALLIAIAVALFVLFFLIGFSVPLPPLFQR